MKQLGNERLEALALEIVGRLERAPEVRVRDHGAAVRAVVGRLREAFQVDAALDRAVRARIASMRRNIPEGSREWDLLYRQYLDELARRR